MKLIELILYGDGIVSEEQIQVAPAGQGGPPGVSHGRA